MTMLWDSRALYSSVKRVLARFRYMYGIYCHRRPASIFKARLCQCTMLLEVNIKPSQVSV